MRIPTGLYKGFIRVEDNWGELKADYTTNSTLMFVSNANINMQYAKEEDAAILGAAFPSSFITVNKLVQGSINFTAHPENLNLLLALHLGKMLQTGGTIASGSVCIFYKGSEESCIVELSGTDLLLKTGNEGAETTELTVDLTIQDTLKKVKDYILANSSNFNVYTIGNEDATATFSFTSEQIKGKDFNSQTLKLDVAGTGGFKHTIANLTVGETKKSFSYIQALGNNWEAFTGLKAGQLTLDIPNGGLITGTSNVLGKEKISASAVSSYYKEKTKVIASAYCKVYVNGELLGYNSVSIDYNPNLFAEVEGGSFFQGEAEHGKKSTFTVNITYHFDDLTKDKIKARFENDEVVETCIVIEANDKVNTTDKYTYFFRLSKCSITEANIDMGGEVFNLPTKIDVLEPDASYRAVEVEVFSTKADLLA